MLLSKTVQRKKKEYKENQKSNILKRNKTVKEK